MTGESAFTIHSFTESDLPEILELIAGNVNGSYTGVYPPKALRFFLEYHSADHILKDATAGTIVVGELNKTIIATASLIGNYVCRVFVHPDYQGHGYGRRIVAELEKLASERGMARLDLDASLVSRRFWQGLGWRIIAREVEMVEDEPLEYYKMEKVLPVVTTSP